MKDNLPSITDIGTSLSLGSRPKSYSMRLVWPALHGRHPPDFQSAFRWVSLTFRVVVVGGPGLPIISLGLGKKWCCLSGLHDVILLGEDNCIGLARLPRAAFHNGIGQWLEQRGMNHACLCWVEDGQEN